MGKVKGSNAQSNHNSDSSYSDNNSNSSESSVESRIKVKKTVRKQISKVSQAKKKSKVKNQASSEGKDQAKSKSKDDEKSRGHITSSSESKKQVRGRKAGRDRSYDCTSDASEVVSGKLMYCLKSFFWCAHSGTFLKVRLLRHLSDCWYLGGECKKPFRAPSQPNNLPHSFLSIFGFYP